ncbi:MAG: hypothetical protein IPK54_05115 [Dokdonella sp.]|jgi:hypothetical protein|uniref:fibronectin type III domain-containing protein n=1 Tax=Dokdonella sp. TaxID=2291710 RepID=UPI001B70F1FA|nr:hypothetical protein [Dokdonella sp.]MBK8122930.1 hypothetical protein [Dokdonella sp.]MBP6326146.1 hypothetical protein [Dokdonella sp.]HNV09291.1 hypothetical protein [Dokdonella sp.]
MRLQSRLIFLGAASLLSLGAQAASPQPEILRAVRSDVSAPMRDIIRNLPPEQAKDATAPHYIPNIFIKPSASANQWAVPDYSGVQRTPSGSPSPAIGANFNGIGNPTACGSCIPPDTNGDVSDVHFIQWVNSKWAVYNKSTGAVVQAPVAGNSFFVGFGGKCETTNAGDPIALYDQQAQRWVMSQFVTSTPYAQCVAVSATSDPLGAYYRYEFNWPLFGDYPKMGVWTDASHSQDSYLLITHEFNAQSAFQGAALIAMDRNAMLAGAPDAAMVRFPGYDAYGVQPLHLIGPNLAPAGACPVFTHFDFAEGNYRFWDMCVNWGNPASTTISTPNTVAGAPFFPYFDDIPQAGTAATLDSFGSNTMYRATARSFSADAPTRMSLVLTHTVQGAPSQAGVKWTHVAMKLASEPTGDVDRIFGDGYDGTPLPVAAPAALTKSMFDEGTYAPADSLQRWMGGVAIDASGNIGLGFSRSSASTNPQVMYVARTATDPAGQMRDEQNCTAGIANGSQTDSAGRWGDYASMSVDPSDQCTFYFTSEYYATNSARNFQTRVCSFTFPDCGDPNFLLVNETPARVELCGATTSTDPTWTLRAGVYNGFTGAVTLNASGLPGGTSASYSTNPFNAPGSSVLTLVGGEALASGEYSFSVTGTSGVLNRGSSLELGVSATTSAATTLVAPANNSTQVSVLPTLSWTASAGALEYLVEVASDAGFTNIIASATVSTTSWKVSSLLNQSTQYFWRVTPQNYCGNGAVSSVFAFTTGLIGQCPSGTTVSTVFSDNFQGGINGWTTGGTGATAWTQQAAPAGTGLSTTVWGIPNNATTSDRNVVSPSIVIPANAAAAFLKFDTYHSFEIDGPTGCWDNGTINIKAGAGPFEYVPNNRLFTDPYDGLVSAGEANAGELGYCHKPNPVPTGGIASVVDLDGYAGQSIQIRYRAVTDSNTIGTAPTGFFIDNFRVEACVP